MTKEFPNFNREKDLIAKIEGKGMKKKMGCKAHWGFQYRSNLMVVRI